MTRLFLFFNFLFLIGNLSEGVISSIAALSETPIATSSESSIAASSESLISASSESSIAASSEARSTALSKLEFIVFVRVAEGGGAKNVQSLCCAAQRKSPVPFLCDPFLKPKVKSVWKKMGFLMPFFVL